MHLLDITYFAAWWNIILSVIVFFFTLTEFNWNNMDYVVIALYMYLVEYSHFVYCTGIFYSFGRRDLKDMDK